MIPKNEGLHLNLSQWLKRQQVKIKFVLVGIWNTIFGYFVFIGFDFLLTRFTTTRYVAYMGAMLFPNILAITNAYFFHKYITFQSVVKGKKMGGEFIKFFSTYLFTILLNLMLLPVFVELLHFHPQRAALLVILICTVISYLGHSRYSFPAEKRMRVSL